VKGAIGLCNPFDLFYLKRYVEKFMFGLFHKIFGKHMLKVLYEHINELRPLEKDIGPLEEVAKKVKTVTDFDRYITSRTYGYGTAHNYYRKGSSVLVICDITIPVLFINSLDDPVVR
jgi:predicted alpha/beta-fold hydrolase